MSSNTYDIKKLQNLLTSLRREAKCILLFLRSVRTVKVFEIGDTGTHSNIFSISISEVSPHNSLSQKHSDFQANLQRRYAAQSYGISDVLTEVVHVQVDFNDYQKRQTDPSSRWLVATQVGSPSQEIKRLAKDLKAFPWVGVALETGASSGGGRVYCTLPMPPDVTCNLPVHVNGTFSLNDERRELKWRGIERQNDPSALWNHLLVKELLPACYAMLLLDHAKLLLEPDRFCEAWPDTNEVRRTPWEEMLTPLLQMLFSKEVIPFSKPGGFHSWIKVSSAVFVPRGVKLHAAVTTALVACGVKLVTAKDRIWNALTFSKIAHKTISPSVTRAELRQRPQSYSGLSSQQKLELLQYCLSDNQYRDLQNLALVPLANGTFVCFGTPFIGVVYYLPSPQCPRYLLPSLEGELVDDSIDRQIYAQLKTIASKGYYNNLQVLSVNSMATLLRKVLPNQNKLTLPHLRFDMQWLKQLWYWIPRGNLHLFQNMPLVPVGGSTVVRLSKASSTLFIPSSTRNYGKPLISALQKMGVECCLQENHPFVHHSDIASLMNIFSSEGIIGAIHCASPSYSNISFTNDEAAELIMQVHSTRSLNPQQQAVLRKLPMFSTLKNTGNQLYSVAQVESITGRVAQIEPPNFPLTQANLPQSAILFSGSIYQKSLLQNLSVTCAATVDILTRLVFPEIEQEAVGRNAAKKIMKEVLEKYNAITSMISRHSEEALQQAIGRLPFVPVSVGKPKAPIALYTPLDPELSRLFYLEPVFPLDPFVGSKYISILKLCGLKTTVSKQEVMDIISSIGCPAAADPVRANEVKYVRAKAILTYIRKWERELNESVYFVAHSIYQQQRISDALKELSVTKAWLPVQSSPPKKYPSCLSWKGSGYNSHFVSFGPSVLLHKEQTSLAFACGSQMYFVEHSLPNAICKAFEPSPGDMVSHIMAHLERVINEFGRIDDMRSIMYIIYEWLNKYSSEGHAVDLSKLEKTKDCVWLTRQSKFVHPHNVALAQNPGFRQNLEPFIYILPDDLTQFESLFKDLEVQEIVTREQILGILSQIKEGDSQSLKITSDQAWQLVMAILHWLTDIEEDDIDVEDLLVPIKSEQDWPALVSAEDVVYTDNSFLQDYLEGSEGEESEYTFVHSRVTRKMAEQLLLTPLSQHLDISEDAFEDVGQSEPLTVRLKNILKDYKDGLTIIKELLQNADDAGATKMNICYDKRHHTDKRLFFPGMAECHGPALVVNNNAMFTEEDFVNITKLAGATKEGKSLKIGKFGIGFCSVYHITDIPSFVSSELLYIFDPTLKHLKDEIKNPARPGKKLCFTSKFIRKSKQLTPYEDLFDFDPKEQYKGTTFRFPFRTTVSELSEKVYTDHDIKQLMEQMQKSSSKLILFLQKIKSIIFSEIEEGQKEPRELMRITKDTVDEDRCIYKITCSANDSSEYWLVATNSKTVLKKYYTSSVACSLSPLGDETCYKARKIEGETFCFLPLSIKTGLPVHVSGNFAVINNRRGIWTSDDSDGARGDEVKWNVSLMKTVVCSAYCGLLETLKELKCDSQLEEYKYYSMWPIEEELLVHNPWYCLVEELYRFIADNELFFSDSTDRWLTLYDSKFLDPDILRVSYNTPFPSAVLEIVAHIELPVVHLPKKYHKHLDLDESIETEKTFLEHFFDTIEQLEDVLESRNDVLCLALECYASELDRKHERFRYLDQLLKGNAGVPCAPDGKELKKPEELVHPSAYFAKLFDVDENVFPLQKFCDKVFVDKAMKELGIIHDSIPITHLEERASGIAELHKVDGLKAMERAQLIIECLVKEDKRETFSPKQCSKLSQTPFLPVMEKPGNYILQWTGQTAILYRGCDIFRSGRLKDDMTNISLAGSQLVFLNQEPPSKGGCGIVGQRAQTLLQIGSSPSYTDVISHFHHLIEEFDGSHEMIELADRTSRKVYEFLEKLLAAESEESEGVGPRLAEKPCIWTGQKFVESKAVASKWNHNGPYLFKVPNSLDRRRYLRKALKIRENFDAQDMVGALQCLKEEFEDTELPDGCQELVKSIVLQMASIEVDKDLGPVMLPDTEFVLHKATQLYHNDMPWAPLDDDYCYVHHAVPLKTAVALGVRLCRTASLAKYSVDSEFLVMEFGQHEELTKRIQNIIRDYPCDMTILKELLQNADDAKATKMHVILDMREHSKEHLLSENWSDLQGPALLVWNDSVFTDDDLIGIQRLGLGSKRSDSDTIGQYGIGFNAVYHLTDCPSFLTGGNRLCILDPHMMYVQHGSVKHPGEMYADLDEKFWKKFDGIKSSYLRDGTKNVPKELLGGTLFRFPLRHTMNHVRSSDIVKDLPGKITDRMISGQKMCDLLEEWAPSMKQTLLFLNNVTELKFSVIRDRRGVGQLHLQNGYTAELDAIACERRSELTQNIRAFDATGKPFITTYPLTIIETVKKGKDLKEEWLIQQGIGDMENSVKTWSYVEQVKPRHGIAAPLRHNGDRKLNGQVFCFLPLPLYSDLPVHINGHFILDSTRRNLWVATDHKRGDDKSHWNENILQALAASYAQFLERIPEYYPQLEGFGSRQSLEQGAMKYYARFPRDKTLSEPWLTLAYQVFQILAKRNSPVLAVPTNISPKASEDKYVLQWQPLRNEKIPASQVYFPQCQEENNLILIFERIGMKITCAPKWIMKHFKGVKCDIPELSQSSVFNFYIRFYTRFISAQFPCPLQDTPFKCVKDFKAFTDYLLIAPNYPALSLFGSSGYVFPKEPFGYPLLLNAAEQLCVFDQANRILCSKHYKVFPSCQNRFLHPELCKCSCSTTYFISATADPKPVRVKIVKELLQTILPKELKNMYVPSESDVLTKFDVKSVWSVLSEDQVFKSVLDEVLKVWALLLTKDKRLFRYQSPDQLRPIIKDEAPPVTSVIEQQLKAPMLDCEIVPTEVVDTYCPRLSKPEEVLQNLVCLQQESQFSEVITVHGAGLLIKYFSRINLTQQLQCCQQLMCLPLFETMDGNLTILQGKKVYVWPVYICQNGNKQWLMGTDLVFLNSTGAWSHLRVDKELGIQRITPEETYVQFIFPKFFKMSKSDRYSHLKYIRDYLFESNFAIHKGNYSAQQFIAGLTNLQCIGEDGEPLKPVSHFYTHQKKIFQTFPEHFQTLPEDLLKGEVRQWMPFFRKIGLQATVKPNTFVSLCQYVANGKLKEKTVAGSEVLLDYLFKHEEAKHHKFHENAQLLSTISQIAFVCPARAPELEWIHKVPPVPNRVILGKDQEISLCKLSGSCISEYQHLLWAVKPTVKIPDCDKVDSTVFQSLGVCAKPTANDLIASVKLIAKTCFSDSKLFIKYTAPQCKPHQTKLMDAMAVIFTHLQKFKDDIDFTKLKCLKCIPVYAISDEEDAGQYPVLVEPRCVVFRPKKDTQQYYPFIHSIHSSLYTVKEFLEKLGIQDSLELEHMQLVLESAFTTSESGTVELDPNTKEVVSCAVVEVKTLLEKNKKWGQQMVEEQVLVEKLKPLYLSSRDKRMHPVESLVYSDIRPVSLDGTGLYVLWTPIKRDVFPKRFCELLPNALQPRALSELCFSKISESCKESKDIPQHINELKRSLCFQNLPQALCLAGKSAISTFLGNSPESERQKLSEKLHKHVENFFESLRICCVEKLRVDLFLKNGDRSEPVASEKVLCEIQVQQQAYILYIDSGINAGRISQVQECVTNVLISCLKGHLKETGLDMLKKLITNCISATSPEEVYIILRKEQINFDEEDISIDEPGLGDTVPKAWHHRLDMSNLNIFQSQEWVAYQTTDQEETYIFAQVSHPVRLRDSAGEPLPPMQMEYIILTSEDDTKGKRVKSIDLYKFMRGETAPDDMIEPAPSESQEIVPFEGDAEEVPPPPAPINLQQAREEVRKELEEIWRLPQDDRKKAIRRLFLKWHPDKNPQSPELAEEVFKFIQNELDRLEKGDGVSASDNSGPYRSWRTYQPTWNSHARQHKHYQEEQSRRRRRGRGGGGGGGGGGGRQRGGSSEGFFSKPFTPPTSETKAKLWARQAVADHSALQVLMNEAQNNPHLYCHVCFVAHEVAEKALKGAMFIKCGLRHPHTSHNIIPLAYSVEQVEPDRARGLSILAEPLESTFCKDTRFPKDDESSCPFEKFTLENAVEAEKCATGILKIVRDIVNV